MCVYVTPPIDIKERSLYTLIYVYPLSSLAETCVFASHRPQIRMIRAGKSTIICAPHFHHFNCVRRWKERAGFDDMLPEWRACRAGCIPMRRLHFSLSLYKSVVRGERLIKMNRLRQLLAIDVFSPIVQELFSRNALLSEKKCLKQFCWLFPCQLIAVDWWKYFVT